MEESDRLCTLFIEKLNKNHKIYKLIILNNIINLF